MGTDNPVLEKKIRERMALAKKVGNPESYNVARALVLSNANPPRPRR